MSADTSETRSEPARGGEQRAYRAPAGQDQRGDRPAHGGEGGDGKKRYPQRRYRKRVLDTRNLNLDYKNSEVLERFVSRTGKILPRRMTGATAKIQRKIAREIKSARMIKILPLSRR